MFQDKAILITGGTGSFGKALVRRLLEMPNGPKRIVIFSRDELKQYEMSCEEAFANQSSLRYFIGDVRDKDRIKRALEGIHYVVHAAALKQVPAAEYNPFEFIKTNVIGGQNLIEAALDSGVNRIVALSTDKAAAPANLYGATKLCSDKLFVAANAIKGERDFCASVVRYGNVMGSRGSVIPFFKSLKSTGVLPITHPEMTRFNITLDDGVSMVLWALENMLGGEVFIPKIPSYRILDVAEAVCPACEKPVIGIRPGEKLHEEMITRSDAPTTIDLGDYYAIAPTTANRSMEQFLLHHGAKPVPKDFQYASDNNETFLTPSQIQALIRDL
ncbi:UDP-N-acetylglucosamine 4,6-dehydratase (inverting) [Litorivicinus sp.]|nr:UDP-N-acetylglucosamine 4,6-dehydratase (inverting) [Litorivicinus sp.]